MGHIFFISTDSSSNIDEIAQWTLFWLLDNDRALDTSFYTCSGIEQAYKALEQPLKNGNSPSLIVIDHPVKPSPSMIQFAEQLHNAIPETWIVEFISPNMPIPSKKNSPHLFWMPKPISQENWIESLNYVLLESISPQWSKSIT